MRGPTPAQIAALRSGTAAADRDQWGTITDYRTVLTVERLVELGYADWQSPEARGAAWGTTNPVITPQGRAYLAALDAADQSAPSASAADPAREDESTTTEEEPVSDPTAPADGERPASLSAGIGPVRESSAPADPDAINAMIAAEAKLVTLAVDTGDPGDGMERGAQFWVEFPDADGTWTCYPYTTLANAEQHLSAMQSWTRPSGTRLGVDWAHITAVQPSRSLNTMDEARLRDHAAEYGRLLRWQWLRLERLAEIFSVPAPNLEDWNKLPHYTAPMVATMLRIQRIAGMWWAYLNAVGAVATHERQADVMLGRISPARAAGVAETPQEEADRMLTKTPTVMGRPYLPWEGDVQTAVWKRWPHLGAVAAERHAADAFARYWARPDSPVTIVAEEGRRRAQAEFGGDGRQSALVPQWEAAALLAEAQGIPQRDAVEQVRYAYTRGVLERWEGYNDWASDGPYVCLPESKGALVAASAVNRALAKSRGVEGREHGASVTEAVTDMIPWHRNPVPEASREEVTAELRQAVEADLLAAVTVMADGTEADGWRALEGEHDTEERTVYVMPLAWRREHPQWLRGQAVAVVSALVGQERHDIPWATAVQALEARVGDVDGAAVLRDAVEAGRVSAMHHEGPGSDVTDGMGEPGRTWVGPPF